MTARGLGVGSALIGASLVAWAIVIHQTHGMDMGPSADFGGLAWYTGLWVAMTGAMMLPSSTPVVLLVDRLSPPATPPFLGGYLVAWTAYGLAAYGLARLAVAAGVGHSGAAGPLIVAAGLYGLTPLKRACLRHCRNPLAFLMRHASLGPMLTGALHGAYCVGCCAGLMLVLFAVGMMSVFWMVVVTALIAAERIAPFGERLVTPIALALVTLGCWLVLM